MNEKRKRILVGLAAGTALTLTLGMTAHAEELDPAEGAGSDLNTTQDVTPTPPETGGETAGGETTGGETAGSTTSGNTPEAQDGGTDVTPEAPAAPVVTVGGFDLADEANASAGWTAGENTGSGWRYDGTSVSMVNNGNAVEVHAEGVGVNLSVAGFNRISTLYADGDVNITGTGIVLIDSIDMLEGTNLNLLTNTDVYADGEGSAAVFLYDPDSGNYRLINGDVAGILDEKYTIPEGVTLVVPDGSVLDLRVTTTVTTETTTTTTTAAGSQTETTVETHQGITQDDLDHKHWFEEPEQSVSSDETFCSETTVSRSISFATPELIISQNAGLTVSEGAQMLMQSFIDSLTGSIHRSSLVVQGALELQGEIAGTGSANGTQAAFSMEVGSTGSVTGSGTLTDAGIHYTGGEGHEDELHLSGGYL